MKKNIIIYKFSSMSSIVILDNVLHEDSFADVQSDLISKLNGSTMKSGVY